MYINAIHNMDNTKTKGPNQQAILYEPYTGKAQDNLNNSHHANLFKCILACVISGKAIKYQ